MEGQCVTIDFLLIKSKQIAHHGSQYKIKENKYFGLWSNVWWYFTNNSSSRAKFGRKVEATLETFFEKGAKMSVC